MTCPMDRVNRVECCNVQCAQEGLCVRSAEAGSAALLFNLCSDCPPVGYPTDRARCDECPRLTQAPHSGAHGRCGVSKYRAAGWQLAAEKIARIFAPFRAKNIAIFLASAYRQGYAVAELYTAAILLRTIAAEAERTGSWHVPADLQEQVRAWVAERDGGAS